MGLPLEGVRNLGEERILMVVVETDLEGVTRLQLEEGQREEMVGEILVGMVEVKWVAGWRLEVVIVVEMGEGQ